MKIIKIISIVCFFIFVVSLFPFLSFAEPQVSEQKITFNFIDVEIPTVIKFISEITDKNFIFDEQIKGKITIIAPTKLSVDESFALFTSVLKLKGFTIVPSGTKAYNIIPSSMAREAGQISIDEALPINEAYITRLLEVVHIESSEAMNFLKPLVSRNGHISTFGPSNLILVVDSALNIDKIASILKRIDQPPTRERLSDINVYPLENADATELAKVLEGIIKSVLSSKRNLPAAGQTPLENISVTPDKATNSLIIIASPATYLNIVDVIKKLDERRRQVFVEAMIVEASIDKLKELGAKWRAVARHEGAPVAIGGFGTINQTTLQNIVTGLTGLTAGGMGNFLEVPITTINTDGTFSTSNMTTPGFGALFSLSDFQDAINVLSTPQILTSNNQEAEIVVGENVPFISSRERDITTTNTVLSSIQRQDVGITLKITPQITDGEYVKLDLYQEISSVKETTQDILTTVGPTTTKRATRTSVVVRDKQTVVISGLMQEKEEESLEKTPLLGDIPIIGWLLFRHKSLTKRKTNLLVFITPYIVKETAQLAELTHEKHKEFAMKEKYYAKGELLIKFKEGVTDEKAREIISQRNAEVIKFIEDINIYYIKLLKKQQIEDAIKEFSSIPDVLYAEPNYKIKINNEIPAISKDIDKKEPVPDVEQTDDKVQNKSELLPVIQLPPEPAQMQTDKPESSGTLSPPESEKIQSNSNADNIETKEAVQSSSELQKDEKTANLKQLPPETDKEYFIQVGAWKNTKKAQKVVEKLKIYYPDTYIVVANNFNKVRVPGVMSREQGDDMVKELKEKFNLKPLLVLKIK